MTGQILQVGNTNIFVNANYGTINVNSGRPIPKLLTAMPYADEQNFIGRSAVMLEISRRLEEENGRKIVQLFGIGGIGKTTIAENFLVAYQGTYNHIAYVEDNGSLIDAIGNNLQLADSLVLNEDIKGKLARKKFDLVISRMRQLKGRNLLVIDNTTEQLEYYDIYNAVKLTTDWDVLVTSRQALQHCDPIEITELSKDDCRMLFYRHYHLEKNDAILDEVLRLVEYHTLTVEVVAMTSERRIFDLQQILEIVKKKPQIFQRDQKQQLRFAGADTVT